MPTLLPSLLTRPSRSCEVLLSLLAVCFALAGCNRFQHITHEYVYVSARQVYLHDRVAAVSNRVGLVTNGEALEVIEKGKRFTKVRTPKNEVGWLEDHAIIDDKLYAQFQDLTQKHAQDPVEATGQLRDDLYLHVSPGRETPHFLLIAGNAKVQLLERGTIAKAAVPGTPVAVVKPPMPAPASGSSAVAKAKAAGTPAAILAKPSVSNAGVATPIPMEDWWLVRDGSGHTGWLLANRIDVDVPDEVGQYAEGQRMVAAYPIAKVIDDGAGQERKGHSKEGKSGEGKSGKASVGKGAGADESAEQGSAQDSAQPAAPVQREFTEYVTVLSPPRGGLPYDFDQIRVFTWSLNHHRYETGYRLHGIQGYLPVKISQETVNGQTYPTFSFAIASGPDVSIDPDSGVTRPVAPRTLSFRLEGNMVRRTGADQAPIVLTHDPEESAKAKAATKKKKR